MLYALIVLALLALIFGPQLWVRSAMRAHAVERDDLPGTGGELARHLLDEAGLQDVKVEPTAEGDHYDPEARVVRLTPGNLEGKSITAVAVAAHEVSHAVQHARGERMFDWRGRLIRLLFVVDQIAMIAALLLPFVAAFGRAPFLIFLNLAVILGLLSLRVLVHLVTLPVETDASFGKALPVLEGGGFLQPSDMPAARSVLRAAAFTYVAAALVSILDILRILRFGR
ncbi:MAG: zinc metallopeptidase [Beijerinckiaceae bacterium]